MTRQGQFRVIISGGGVAGLVLASALEHAGIEYVLLERRAEIAPQVGASIGIFPNAARILDQLGAWEQLRDKMARIDYMANSHDNGVEIGVPTNIGDLLISRTSYGLIWGDRQTLLEVLYGNVRDKTKLLVNKKVISVNHTATGVTVTCEEGSSYDGDILVGADGVYSKTREEMWRLAEPESPALVKSEKDVLKAEYNCLFGIAKLPPGWFKTGRLNASIGRHRSAFLIPGKGGRAYFFVEERLNKMHKLGNFPRYNNEETEAFVARNSDIRYNQGPTVADVWKTAVSYRLVPLEEGLFKIWTWGRLDRLFVSYGMAHLSDFMPEMISGMMIGAVKLDFLPLPLASLRGKEPFNPAQGYGSKESKLRRALSALPFLMLVFAKLMVLDTNFLLPWAEEILENGAVEVGGEPVPIMRTFHRVKGVDDLFSVINTFCFQTVYNFAPTDRAQGISFLTDISVIITIWGLESVRRANRLTILQLPSVFTFAGQIIGLGVLAPLYAFLHYISTPIETFGALDRRLTSMRYTRALPLAVLLGFLVPLYGAYLHPDLLARQFWLFVWQLYPMWVAGALFLFSRVFADTVEQDKIDAPKRDLPHVRFAVGISVLISAGAWVAATLLGPYSLKGLFLPATIPKNTTNLNDAAVQFLRIDELAIFGSALLWLGYLFGDMKRAGMDVGWLRLLLYGPASVLTVGPGATLGMGWLWREDILANRWHKDACKGENLERLGETVSKANGRLRGGK